MKKFQYLARDKSGKEVKGVLEARSPEVIVEILQGKGLIVVEVKEDLGLNMSKLNEINIGGVPMSEKVLFMRQFATMISAGLSLTKSLDILTKQVTNPLFQRVLVEVLAEVEGGSSLSKAFRKQSDVFDDVVLSMIEAGEASGNLETVLQRLANELESKKKLQDKIRSAFTYPAVIVVVMLAVVVLLMLVLVPAMKDVYSEFDAELPLITKILMSASDFFISFWWLVLMVLAITGVGIKMFLDTAKGKRSFDLIMLKIPIFGKLMVKIQLTQFSRTLSLLLKSGLSIVEALRLTSESLSNSYFKDAVIVAMAEVEKGTPLTIPIARSEYFPVIVSQMIAVGEESGELDGILEKMADFFNEEVDTMSGNLSTLLEPFILIVMGGIIAFIALAVYMPMFSLTEVIG